MNKQDWTYKKLGEVATIVGGSTPKSNIEEYWGGTHYWVTPADLDGNKYQGATPRTITDLAVQKTNLQILPIGTVLLSSRAPIGKVAITTVPMYCNQGFKNIICSDLLLNEFVYWFLYGKVDYLNSLGRGATFKEISKKTTEQIPIPVPPLGEQERIVAELDLLSGIIDKKKEQLKAYDQLAQSIFYTMFGDPIDNPKGWETDILENIVSKDCSISYGVVQPGDDIENGIPIVRPVDLVNHIVTRKGLKQIEKRISDDYKRTILKGGEILFCVRGTTGVMSFASDDLKGCNVTRGITPLSFNETINKYYAYFYLKTDGLQAIIADNTRGIALKQINMKDVRALPFLLPPLSLQQEFAEKVESIERQKALIRQSIDEVQTLFDYTMDKYFG